MTSLAQRLQNVQAPMTETRPDLSHLSLQDLKEQKIAFGKTHQGRTFQEVWDNEQTWVKWFVQRFADSNKAEHVIFLKFVELMIERAELTGKTVPLTNQTEVEKVLALSHAPKMSSAMPKTKAKAQAKMAAQIPVETSVWDLDEEEDPELFEMIREEHPVENNVQIQNFENRMQGVERALASILQHLENMTVPMATPH
eukprot:s3443_g7.t1